MLTKEGIVGSPQSEPATVHPVRPIRPVERESIIFKCINFTDGKLVTEEVIAKRGKEINYSRTIFSDTLKGRERIYTEDKQATINNLPKIIK